MDEKTPAQVLMARAAEAGVELTKEQAERGLERGYVEAGTWGEGNFQKYGCVYCRFDMVDNPDYPDRVHVKMAEHVAGSHNADSVPMPPRGW